MLGSSGGDSSKSLVCACTFPGSSGILQPERGCQPALGVSKFTKGLGKEPEGKFSKGGTRCFFGRTHRWKVYYIRLLASVWSGQAKGGHLGWLFNEPPCSKGVGKSNSCRKPKQHSLDSFFPSHLNSQGHDCAAVQRAFCCSEWVILAGLGVRGKYCSCPGCQVGSTAKGEQSRLWCGR